LYDQLDSHIEFINDKKSETASGDDQDYMPKTDDMFVSLVDTMRMNHVQGIDHERIDEIHSELLELVPSVFTTTFKARYKHHIINMVAGMAKYHYLVDDRATLTAMEKDYEEAAEIMETIISSWGNVNLNELSYRARVNSLKPGARKFFETINDEPGILGKELLGRVDTDNAAQHMSKLRQLDLVAELQDEGMKTYYPYWSQEYRQSKEMEQV